MFITIVFLKEGAEFLKSADLYMRFVIMLTDTVPGLARSGVSMRYFSPRYRKKDQKKYSVFARGGGGR
jgi:hypothetical protein